MGERERDVMMVAGLQTLPAQLPKTFAARKKKFKKNYKAAKARLVNTHNR